MCGATCMDNLYLLTVLLFVVEIQKKRCYRQVVNKRCSQPMVPLLSLADCCCDSGKGWGDQSNCQICPQPGDGKNKPNN